MFQLRPLRFWLTLLLLGSFVSGATAAEPWHPPMKPREGMWLPNLITQNFEAMKRMGFELTPQDIYSVNQSSMKDVVVSMNGGMCTCEVVSDQGLLFTNHHCAYDAIQSLSTTENDILTNGFWSESLDQEKRIEDMKVSFLRKIVDVTDKVKQEVDTIDSEMARQQVMRMAHQSIKDSLLEDKSDFHRVDVKSMFFGDKHYAFIYEDYKDIRLVGNPPESIGKFGGDTDNWMWPRHTGDFSLLRIYANDNNEPAEYSADNVPYKPEKHLKISLEGLQKGDYTMIMGYPGRTNRYLTSYDIEQRFKLTNPSRIKLRDKRLSIMKSYMDKSKKLRLMYASKYAGISNYYKYFKGQNRGFRRKNTVQKRKEFEEQFQEWATQNEARKEQYGDLLEEFEQIYKDVEPYRKPVTYFGECLLAPELFSFFYSHSSFLGELEEYNAKKAEDDKQEEMRQKIDSFMNKELKKLYKDYHVPIDRDITAAMLRHYYQDLDAQFRPKYFEELVNEYDKDFDKLAADLFKETPFTSRKKMEEFMEKPGFLQKSRGKKLKEDRAYKLFNELYTHLLSEIRSPFSTFRTKKRGLSRKWVKGQMAMFPDSNFYPNANSTMRLTYGKVKGLQPRDAVEYRYYTTLEGVMQKHNPNDKEFHVPDKLMRLYENKNFGRYARQDGQMPVCFVHKTDITGGNSGSPVMNAEGELVGIAFDGNWESMTSDIVVQPKVTRTISVDARYVLFVIDKFAGADRIIEELDIVDKSRASRQ